ncbi:MAG: BamA/TamA family outer membrane protein, partial [Gammaproteobacteria bacterium]
RWRTPVGMVRLDFAHPVKRPDLDRIRIHFSIGTDL